MPLRNSVFIDCYRRQRSSTEIVIYSSDVRQIVEISYPTARGICIRPHRVFAYLNTHGTYWECFCALASGHPTPARFVDIVENGHVVCTKVVCHYLTSQCGFSRSSPIQSYVNLNETHHTAMLTSSYPEFPTIARGVVPSVERLITNFHRVLARTNLGRAEIAPHFDEYLGTLASQYPGYSMPTKSCHPIVPIHIVTQPYFPDLKAYSLEQHPILAQHPLPVVQQEPLQTTKCGP
ncbi:hypothetical protein PAXINDRAFT_158010 [Paxillus involutus ATCC 200175]|uniref:Uncharacterized protein n=1 Tax=Paxillus involutus ATCC 200175 TaxID=664439 RepID=A0A0C9SPG6_PAXIN|nr:hypothetical protein PAXINDRAFT_158010 [Paxillus involutus ATCC 200175]